MFVVILLMSFIYGGKPKYVAYIDGPKNMIEASTFCSNKCGGYLAKLDNGVNAVLPDIVPSDMDDQIFVGYYTGQTKWIGIYGCFKHNETEEKSLAEKEKIYNDIEYRLLQKDIKSFASSCELFCDPYQYIAKMGNKCICFETGPNSLKVDSRKCFAEGKLFNTERGYIMFFKTLNESTRDNGNCGLFKCGKTLTHPKSTCVREKLLPNFICINQQQKPFEWFTEKSWEVSVEFCMKNASYLALSAIKCDIGRNYWRAVFKHQGLIVAKDYTLTSFSNHTQCGYIQRANSSIDFNLSYCGEYFERPFLCEYDYLDRAHGKCKKYYRKVTSDRDESTINEASTSNCTTGAVGSKTVTEQYSSEDTSITVENSTVTAMTKMQQTSDIGSTVGIALGIFILMSVIVVACVLILRKRKQKLCTTTHTKPGSNVENEYQNVNIAVDINLELKSKPALGEDASKESTENLANNSKEYTNPNFSYDFVKPLQPSNDREFNNISGEDNSQRDMYCNDLNEGEYDHLGNSWKHSETSNDQTLYDHTMTPTQRRSDIYDHTVTHPLSSGIGIYDHTAPTSQRSSDLYDHTVTSQASSERCIYE